MKLSSEAPSKPNQRGTRGYIGRLDIRTDDNFGITITLDQYDGSLYELYILLFWTLRKKAIGLSRSNGKSWLTSVPRCDDFPKLISRGPIRAFNRKSEKIARSAISLA